ncbi:protein enabled homolog [Suricata suricatta]|uniref:protein enabled homolog n=1 Tax=Suricata suricatta TaxID=37032 RepID=UPI0011557124|nr:protein enabled homolog [Suricata suricatta]
MPTLRPELCPATSPPMHAAAATAEKVRPLCQPLRGPGLTRGAGRCPSSAHRCLQVTELLRDRRGPRMEQERGILPSQGPETPELVLPTPPQTPAGRWPLTQEGPGGPGPGLRSQRGARSAVSSLDRVCEPGRSRSGSPRAPTPRIPVPRRPVQTRPPPLPPPSALTGKLGLPLQIQGLLSTPTLAVGISGGVTFLPPKREIQIFPGGQDPDVSSPRNQAVLKGRGVTSPGLGHPRVLGKGDGRHSQAQARRDLCAQTSDPCRPEPRADGTIQPPPPSKPREASEITRTQLRPFPGYAAQRSRLQMCLLCEPPPRVPTAPNGGPPGRERLVLACMCVCVCVCVCTRVCARPVG